MTQLAPKTTEDQQIPSLHYYHDVKWRLLAEIPWLVIALLLTTAMFIRIIVVSGGNLPLTQMSRAIIPNIMIMGFLVVPMIVIVAGGDADLSVGFLAGAAGWIVATLSPKTGLASAVFMSLLFALLVGLIHGLLVGLARLKGIVVTFAMSFFLSGLILVLSEGKTTPAPEGLGQALARSPLSVLLWIVLVVACAALMIFTPFGRRARAGDQEHESLGQRLLYKGLPFVFSSFMAWISGILLLSWIGYATIGSGSGYTEMALLAALAGGTAYFAGTGFVLSGAIALIAVVLFQNGNMLMNLSPAIQRVTLGVLLLIMLPIAHYYHVGVDWLYHRRGKKAQETPLADVPQLLPQ